MGRNIEIDARRGGGAAHEILFGEVTIEATALRQDGTKTVFPAPTTIGISNGTAVLENVDVSPAGPEPTWAYRMTFRDHMSGRGWSEMVGVPTGTTAVKYPTLPRFTTAIPPETTKAELQNWVATTEAAKNTAVQAAARAEAPTDEMNSSLINNPTSLTSTAMRANINMTVDNSKNPALGLFMASLGLCHSRALRIVTLGSSTTAGYLQDPADWWVTSFLQSLQSNYAVGPGAETIVGTLDTTPSNVPGIHLHNGGISNTTSANYLTSAMVSKIGVIQPTLITHMIGSNDAKNGMSPTTYRANLINWLDQLDTAIPTAHTHVLIHGHERSDANITAVWDMYREVLRGLSQERSNVVFVDVSEDFRSLGIPGADPLGLRHPDKIHLTPLGSDHLCAAINKGLGVPHARPPRQLAAVDTFSRADGPLGSTDTGQTWVISRGGISIVSGKATQTAANLVAMCESGLTDIDVSCILTHGGETNSLAGMIFGGTDDGTWLAFSLNAGTSKDVAIYISIAGTLTKIVGATLSISPGTFELRAVKVGNIINCYVDNELVLTHRLSRARMTALGNGSKIGFRSALLIPSLRYDNLTARAL